MGYVHVHAPYFELFGLNAEVVFELTLLCQEICFVAVVEPHPVGGEGSHQVAFNPVDVSACGWWYLRLPKVCDSTLRTLPPLRRYIFWG